MNRSGNKEKIMPTFNVIVPEGRLSSEQKTRVAVATGRTYKELTGVPENLTQVIFIEVKHGDYFVGTWGQCATEGRQVLMTGVVVGMRAQICPRQDRHDESYASKGGSRAIPSANETC